ncbi:MAG TPA: DUF692 family protein [Vicinamibacterales bacterium]|nr:DUF692 family protein [Vicinamibacterales bacterium]
MTDRVGLTWHPRLAAAILAARDRIDVVEVIPEGTFLGSRPMQRALRRLAREIPVAIHGVSLGLASTTAVDERRVARFARLIDYVQPDCWSEHLAFVRAGTIELGHLAAPSRTATTIDASAANIHRAARIIGAHPFVENVASIIDPPGSSLDERTWLTRLLATTQADLLLDLHNLYANATNFGFNAAEVLRSLPPERIRFIHLAGGAAVRASTGEERWLDDHLHDVPDPVYDLLEIVGESVPHAVDVVLERDGAFPPFNQLLAQLEHARTALARGRARRPVGS